MSPAFFRIIVFAVAAAPLSGMTLPAAVRPTVVELYTSQGCANCPPADAILKELTRDPSVLPLAFHVHYWDRLGWTDPYASTENSQRQNDYEAALGVTSLFTPQMIIDGRYSVVGSEKESLADAIGEARNAASETPVSIAPDASGKILDIVIGDGTKSSLPPHVEVTEIHFNRNASTTINAGENNGRTLESPNYVTEIIPLELAPTYSLPLSRLQDDGVAIIVQGENQGPVAGAGVYMKNGADKNGAL